MLLLCMPQLFVKMFKSDLECDKRLSQWALLSKCIEALNDSLGIHESKLCEGLTRGGVLVLKSIMWDVPR